MTNALLARAPTRAWRPPMASPQRPISDRTAPDVPLVSVIVLSFNYARYLRQCIDSVLAQEYSPMEVIVVDDGSTDDSRAIIESYAGRIVPFFKANGGEASSMNAGFGISRGSIVLFVDSDDHLLPGAIDAHVRALDAPGVVRSQAYLSVLHDTRPSGDVLPGVRVDDGDLRDLLLRKGPGAYVSPPNSGNGWSRWFLEQVFPLPEEPKTIGGETFLMDGAPLFGRSVTLTREPKAVYRLHDANTSAITAEMTVHNIQTVLAHRDVRIAWLEKLAVARGYVPRTSDWRASNWRMLTLEVLLGRLKGHDDVPSLGDHVRPALASRGHPIKRLPLVLALIAIRVVPVTLALSIARRLIKMRYM